MTFHTPHARPETQHRPLLLTLADVVNHLLQVQDLTANETHAVARCLRAARHAAGNIGAYHRWKLYQSTARVTIHGVFNDGTIDYDASTGVATLSTGSWPEWAAYGELQIDDAEYSVVGRLSDTTIQLSQSHRPESNLTGSTFRLVQRRSPLPLDFRGKGRLIDQGNEYEIRDVSQEQAFESETRFIRSSSVRDVCTVTGDPRFQGAFALQVSPPPSADVVVKMNYDRYPRVPQVYRTTGTVTSVDYTLTATGVLFTELHPGSVIRFGVPGGEAPSDPFYEESDNLLYAERVITERVTDQTAKINLPLDGVAMQVVISDPIDAMHGPMTDAILRLAEYELARGIGSKESREKLAFFHEQLRLAMSDDQRYTGPMSGTPELPSHRSEIGQVNVV